MIPSRCLTMKGRGEAGSYLETVSRIGMIIIFNFYLFIYFLIITRGHFSLLSETETAMQERIINCLPPVCTWTGDQTCNPGMCPD